MIPNAGLDNIAAYDAWYFLTGSDSPPSGSDWLGYAAISEDSQEPLATDVNIGTERARTNSTGGFNRTATAIRDPNTDRLGISIERAYVFDITGSWNITKYGYVPVSSGGNFSWIDLVRSDPNDPQSSPIALTLEPGDQLQLWCTFTATVPWSVDLEPFVITGAAGNDSEGTHDAYCGFFAGGTSTAEVAGIIRGTFWPTLTSGRVWGVTAPANADRDASPGPIAEQVNNPGSLAPYQSGDYYRDKHYTFTTAQLNRALTAIQLGATSSFTPYGFKIVFDDPATFTKENTHELTLTFRVSWQEA